MKSKQPANPVKGGVRRRRIKMPLIGGNGDNSIVRYSTLGINLETIGATGNTVYTRYYIPGEGGLLTNASGPSIVSYYSTGKFLPGTKLKWEPSVSFTTSGRVFAGFIDNPEIAVQLQTAYNNYILGTGSYAAYANLIKGLGNVVSFPVWQETEIPFQLRMRRKRFDVNETVASTSDTLDRCMQTSFWVAIEGVNASAPLSLGGFHFHDIVDVEGVNGATT